MTKRQRIDASRETRLWIRDVIIPAAIGITTLMSIPGVREATGEKINEAKVKIKETKMKVSNKFKK